MLLDSRRKTFKIITMLCAAIAMVMGVICQVHTAPHDHALPASSHHEDDASPPFEVFSCVTAIIPSVDWLPVLLFLMLSLLLPPLKPLALAFELDIPPRYSLS
jgi:hypothetical protein